MPLAQSVILETARLAYDDIRETYPQLALPPYPTIEIANTTAKLGRTHFSYNAASGEYRFKKFTLSKYLNDRITTDETMRHEVAHLIAGFKAEHGPRWKQAAVMCGVEPEAGCSGGLDLPQKLGYTIECRVCRRPHIFQRVTKTLRAVRAGIPLKCSRCKNYQTWLVY